MPPLPVAVHEAPTTAREVTVHGVGAIADCFEQAATAALAAQGWGPARERDSGWTGLAIDGARLVLTDGRCAARTGGRAGHATMSPCSIARSRCPCPPAPRWPLPSRRRASDAWRTQARGLARGARLRAAARGRRPGLVVARTVAMLINEAADAVQQGVCTPEGADAAMKLGVNYPAGPFEWLADWNAAEVVACSKHSMPHYRGERYRVSPWLRRRAEEPRRAG